MGLLTAHSPGSSPIPRLKMSKRGANGSRGEGEVSHGQTARDLGWSQIPAKSGDQGRMESYCKDGVRLNYYPSTECVGTSMDRPTQGRTQLFRRDVPVEQVLANPRTHTGQGYYTKK